MMVRPFTPDEIATFRAGCDGRVSQNTQCWLATLDEIKAERDRLAEHARTWYDENGNPVLLGTPGEVIGRRIAAAQMIGRLTEPDHECEPVAEIDHCGPGREWWIGRITKPVIGYEHETHCLHITTPRKAFVLMVTKTDLNALHCLMSCVEPFPAAGWLESQQKSYTSAAARRSLRVDEAWEATREIREGELEGERRAGEIMDFRMRGKGSE
jgi:hypothetical protein